MRKIDKELGVYITLKELADAYELPKVTVNYYVLRGLLKPVFMVGKTNLYNVDEATKVIEEIVKKKRQNLTTVKEKLNIK